MIKEAVEKLNGGRGSCEEAISEYIKNEYNSLPWAHPTILTHHLNKLSKKGDIIVRCERGYILRSATISSSPCPSPSVSSDCSPYSTSSSSSGCDSPTPTRRRLKRKRNIKKSRIHGNGNGIPRLPIPSRGPGRPRKKDEIEKFKRKMMIQTREMGGTRKTIHGKKRGRPRKKQTDVGEEHHQVLEVDNQLVELENVVEENNQVADMETEEIKENNEVELRNQVVLEQSKAEDEHNLAIRSEQQGRGDVKKRKKHKKQEKVISAENNSEERQNDGLEENEQAAEKEVIVDLNQSVPDHPSYLEMIEEAVEKLNEGRGSSEEAISEYIKNEYNSLSMAHPILVAHHLNKLSKAGDIIVRCEQGYILRSTIISSTSESDSSPSSSSYSISSISLGSDSSGPDSSPRRRPLKRSRNRKKRQIQGKGRGRSQKNIPGRGRGRRRIRKGEKGGSRKTIQGRKRGRPRKNNETSEDGHLRLEQTDVDEEHLQVIKEVDQSVEHEDAFGEYTRVADMRMEEIRENNDVQAQNQVVSEQSKAEEQNHASRSESLGRGAVEEREEHQKQEKLISEILIQREEWKNDGGDENEESAEKEVIVDQNQPWKQEDKIIAGEGQGEELRTFIGDESSRQQKQGEEVVEGECQDKEQHIEIGQEGVELEFEVSEGQCQEEEQQTEVIHVDIQLEDKVVEGRYQKEEQQDEVVPEEIQLEDKVNEEQQDVQMIMTEAEEDGKVEGWNGQREEDKGGSLEHNESEKQVTDALEEQILQKKLLMDVIAEKNQQYEPEEKDQGEEIQDNIALKEKILQQKLQEMEIVEEDQLQGQKVEVPEEVHPQEELQVEVFQEEILREMEVVKEQLELGIIMNEELENGGVEKLSGQQKQVKGISLLQREVEHEVIMEQKEQQEEKIQTCEHEETMEQQDRQEVHSQPCEQEDIFSIKGDLLVKPETEVAERIHQQEEQQIDEISAGQVGEKQQVLGTIRSEAEGGSAEERSEHHEEEKRERAEVNRLEEHDDDVSEEQDLAQEQCSEGNKAKIQACELRQRIIMEINDQTEQEIKLVDRERNLEEELNVESFEKENQQQGKRNVESLQSCDVRSDDSKALPCKSFWSLMEDEKDKFLNNFRDQELKSPCQEGEISYSSMKSEEEQIEIPPLESSPKSHIEEISYLHNPRTRLQHSTSHTGNGRSSELIICALPCIKKFLPPDYQNKSEQRRSGWEGLRSRSRNVDEVATSERQPVRRSPRHLNTSSDAAAIAEELEQSKERPKRQGLRSEKNMKAGVLN